MMVSMLISVYSSAAGSELVWALLHPSTTAVPPAITQGDTDEPQQLVQHQVTREPQAPDTFANVFPEIKHPLQDSISLLCHFHVLVNLMRRSQDQVRTPWIKQASACIAPQPSTAGATDHVLVT